MKYQNNQHFSHHHVLTQLTLVENESISCNMCNLDITEPFHGCLNCNHYLHESCLNTPRSLSHPSHSKHPLSLHSTPTYPSRSFSCDACGSEGDGYTLCCAHCECDLHLQCANSPLSIQVKNHPHELKLLFKSPVLGNRNVVTACDVCGGMINKNYWLYLCDQFGCDFGAHIDCVNGKARPKAASATTTTAQHEQGSSSAVVSSAVDDMNAVAKAQQELYAAQAMAQIQLQANRAAVEAVSGSHYRYI